MSKSPRQYQIITNKITAAMIKSVSLDSFFESVTTYLKETFNLFDCWILLSETTSNQINNSFNFPGGLATARLLELENQEPKLLATRSEIESMGIPLDTSRDSWQSLAVLPLVYNNRAWGAIALIYSDEQKQWQEIELSCLNNIANQCAIAIYLHILELEKTATENLNQEIFRNLDYTFHECRQPLSAILGLARMLNEQIYGTLNQKQIEYVQAIITSGEHLLSLTNNFLDLSKIEAHKEELFLERVLVAEICQASIAIVQESANQKQISLILEIEPEVNFCIADPLRLKQILVNLLSNGIKYSEQGSVTLRVTKDNQGFWFSVTDTGIGISPENQQKLFEPFAQIPNSYNRKQKGTGLGLVLSRNLARLHGGDLTLKSEVGKGSCFTLYLPFQQSG